MVNPHKSLLLGVSDFETPAEIDGLLDDYFHSRDSVAMAYNDPTGEKSASQHSLQTSSSNGRQRILYDDPESARRKIMGLQNSGSQQTVLGPRYDTPIANRGTEPQTSIATFVQPRPATPVPFATRTGDRRLQIHPNLRAALGTDTRDSPYYEGDPYDLNQLATNYQGLGLEENRGTTTLAAPAPASRGKRYHPVTASLLLTFDLGEGSRKAVDRGSSLYPHSQRSNPFDLTISDVGDSPGYQNIDGVVAATRSSYYAGDGALYDKEEDFAVYEDAPDANAYVTSPRRSRFKKALTRCFVQQD